MGTRWKIEWNFKKQIINMSVRANMFFKNVGLHISYVHRRKPIARYLVARVYTAASLNLNLVQLSYIQKPQTAVPQVQLYFIKVQVKNFSRYTSVCN
eukprot:SAG31_NODE_5447_length_2532_cov_17.404439_1_plen_97_part_00